jgi:YidC/Oxa1 family membrane protein insertase
MLVVAILPAILFPSKTREPGPVPVDSLAIVRPDFLDAVTAPPVQQPAQVRAAPEPVEATPSSQERLVTVESSLYKWVFSTNGARLIEATLKEYEDFATSPSGVAQLLPDGASFLQFGLLFGNDTVPIGDWHFEPDQETVVLNDGGSAVLRWVGTSGQLSITFEYVFRADDYLFDIRGQFTGVDASALLLVGLAPGVRQIEADSVDNYRSFGVVTKANKTESLKFSSLDPGERRTLSGPFEWVAVKSKYFVLAVMTLDEGQPQFGGAIATGGPRSDRTATRTDVVASLPAPGGSFSLSAYLGPQEFRRLQQIGHDFEDINPYGWILRPVIRPFANMIVIVLLWMHETLNLEYGWVLVLFGLAVRVVLWPLNQKAMRSSMAMQALQPEIKALQDRMKNDPQKLQQEMMKLYKEHHVNPLGGCLPLLIPMPVLFALFFVFRQTIQFRGVPFLWLPDLSRADPLYIIPIIMGLSMYAVTKIGQRGMPPNPQMKMMLYFMPGFMTFIFLRLSSGLNLYYAVSNIASIPQQWIISQERMRRLGTGTPEKKK